jgi:hypothetical protein
MRFPHLVWAIGQKRRAHYEAAAEAGASESRFSRCLAGRAEFSSLERQKLAAFLGYPADWLFQQIRPPERGQPSDQAAGLVGGYAH